VYHPLVIHRDTHYTHPMVTRQAVGVLWPRALAATEGEPRLSPIPTSVREALADPNWCRAMEEELFLPTRLGTLCHVRRVAMW
jgi:hypothetical protein